MIHLESSGQKSREAMADQALREQLFADAYGREPVTARAALDSLRRIYRLRLPLVEVRLNDDKRSDA